MSENKKSEKIVGVKGMNDVLPADAPLWELFENTVQTVLKSYGFQQIRTPIVESTALFARGLGAVTDIVEKEIVFLHRLDERRSVDAPPGKHGRRAARRVGT